MSKNNIQIQYEQIKLTPAELEARLFKALNILINYEDIYEETDDLQSAIQD